MPNAQNNVPLGFRHKNQPTRRRCDLLNRERFDHQLQHHASTITLEQSLVLRTVHSVPVGTLYVGYGMVPLAPRGQMKKRRL